MGRNLSEDLFFFALHLILGEKWDEIWVWQFQILIYVPLKFSEVSSPPPPPLFKILRTLLSRLLKQFFYGNEYFLRSFFCGNFYLLTFSEK